MKVIGTIHAKVADLFTPGGWEPLMLEPQTIELAHSIKRTGVLQDPVVRKSDMRVGDGRHRVAAVMLNGHKTIRVKLVECSDLELQIAEATTVAVRRHDPEERREAMLRLLDLYEQLAMEEDAQVADAGPGGAEVRVTARRKKPAKSRKSPRGHARARVAREFGVTEREVRRREQQANEPEPVGHLDLIGMTVGTDFLKEVGFAQIRIRRAAQHLKSAQGELTKIRTSGSSYPDGRLQRILTMVHDATAVALNAVPASICPYCKGLDGLIERCATCLTAGYVGDEIVAQAPTELLDEKEPAVAVDGKMVLVAEFLASQPAPWD